jgi:AcrR family transcriptional regulator
MQARSQQTVTCILEASARILETEGLPGFNTNAVARKAGVSIGSLYQYFPNKDAILLGLISSFEETLDLAVERAVKNDGGEPLRIRLREVVRALFAVHHQRSALNRILEVEEERLGHRSGDSTLRQMVLRLLREHRDELAVPPSATVAEDIIGIAKALMDTCLLSGARRKDIEQRTMRALCGYLLFAG